MSHTIRELLQILGSSVTAALAMTAVMMGVIAVLIKRTEGTRSESFPHAKTGTALHPITDFKIGARFVSLYAVEGRVPGYQYSLYWNDERNPIQHNMSPNEVFIVLHGLLDPEGK